VIDIIEQELLEISENLFNTFLFDRTTRKNICWATDHYISQGDAYSPQEPITKDLITGLNSKLVKPRVSRSNDEKTQRTKDKAEVFTPSWICNEQNNLIDTEWFGRPYVFNTVVGQTWESVKENIQFPKAKTWKQYVKAKRLEISCGEAPYLVSRYDTVTGNEIQIADRIGLLDRKLRIVNENIDNENEWYFWVKRAYESTYGYEYQGDNLLIARENLIYTFIENMEYKYSKRPSIEQLFDIAKVISWNIWQMDGITMTAPFSEQPRVNRQISLFDYMRDDGLSDGDLPETEPIPCKIFDWRSNKSLEFKSITNGGRNK
jgi:hypothetical protein